MVGKALGIIPDIGLQVIYFPLSRVLAGM